MTVIPFPGQASCCCGKTAGAPFVIHLPVAPQVVARTRFSPPPPSRSGCLTVPEAMDYLAATLRKERREGSTMVAITGPGDPLATPDITLQAIEQIRATYPDLEIGLKTLGLGSSGLAGKLARAGLNYVEMQVDGTKPLVLEKIYAWIRPGMKTLKISEAVALLIKEQRHGVSALKFHELKVVVTTTVYPGLNSDHVAKIGAEMMELGADGIGLIPYAPEAGAEVSLEIPSPEAVAAIAEKASTYLPIVEPLLLPPAGDGGSAAAKAPLPRPTRERPNVAVVSSNGIEVDLHLGQAIRLLVYGPRADGLTCLLEVRDAPEPGTGPDRWRALAAILPDCFALLAASAGETPRKVLAQAGIKVLITEDNIEGTVDVLYGGGKKGRKK